VTEVLGSQDTSFWIREEMTLDQKVLLKMLSSENLSAAILNSYTFYNTVYEAVPKCQFMDLKG
jgi:hypothetical protein